MGTYTLIFERTVRVRKYETLKMGYHAEFDEDSAPPEFNMAEIQRFVDHEIIKKRRELRADRSK